MIDFNSNGFFARLKKVSPSDSELELYLSGVGKVKFQFTGSTDVKEICRYISEYTLA